MNKELLLGWSVLPTLLLTVLSFAETQILLHEDFEGYANETELNEVWPKVGNAFTHLAKDPVDPSNTTLFSKGDRRIRTFPSTRPTNESPLCLSVDYYDDYKRNVSGREYIGLWATPSDPGAVIEVGVHKHADPANTTDHYYSARVFGSPHGTDWFDLNTRRQVGWRKIQVWVFADTVEIYIDGELNAVTAWTGGPIGAVRVGFGSGLGDRASFTSAHYDNLRIERSDASGRHGTVIELSDFSPEDLRFAEPGA